MCTDIHGGHSVSAIPALIARSDEAEPRVQQCTFGIYRFHPASAKVQIRDSVVKLTRREFELALMLFRQTGSLLPRATVLEVLWQNDENGASRSLDTHICRIRKHLKLTPANGFVISTIYRRGYRLDAATLASEAIFEYSTSRRRQ